MEERGAIRELGAVGVARLQCAARRIDGGDHVHRGLRAQVAQHPLDVAGGREPARPARAVGDFQHRILDRRFPIDEHAQLGADALLGVLEHAVAEAVPRDVGRGAAARQRRRRPEMRAVFVAQVERLAAGFAHGIVAPGSQPELVGVLAPGVAKAALRDHGAELRVGEHVDPRRRRALAGRSRDYVLAAIGAESAHAVEKPEVGAARFERHRRARRNQPQAPGVPARGAPREAPLGNLLAADLLGQRSRLVADHGARDRFEQDAVLVRDLLRAAHENAARSLHHLRLDARGDQSHDLVLEQLPVAGVVLVPDHQIHRQSLQPPVGMRLHQLAHELDAGRVADLQQHDRQIARDGVAPQPRLPAAVLHQRCGAGAQRRIRIEHRARQAAIQLGVGLRGVDLAQRHPAVRRREVEHAVRQMPVLVLAGEREAGFARLADAEHHVDGCRFTRLERDAAADGHDRIQDRALAAREGSVHRLWRRHAAAAPDEACAIGFIGNLGSALCGFPAVHRHHVEHPRARARPPSAAAACRGSPGARARSRSARTGC